MSTALKVLLIDDQPIIAAAVRQMLAESDDLQLHAITDPTLAVEEALRVAPLVVLLDVQMEPISGLDVLDAIRAEPSLSDVPVLMLSAAEEPQTKVESFRRGANDYVVKLPSALELDARIRYHARACQASRDREAAFQSLLQSQQALAARNAEIEAQKLQLELLNRELAQAAVTDPLTGLRNRRYVRRLLGRSDGAGPDEHAPLSQFGPLLLCLLDLDRFKSINDCHGHEAGDSVLVEVARRLRHAFHDAPCVARWGGEEILLILRRPENHLIEPLLRAVLAAVGSAPIAIGDGMSLEVRASAGFACFPDREIGFDDVLRRVDSAVYRAKAEGRNRAVGSLPDDATALSFDGPPID